MSEKKITISIKSDPIIVPGHLKKPDTLDINIEGVQQLEAIKIIASVLPGLISDFEIKLNTMLTNQPTQIK